MYCRSLNFPSVIFFFLFSSSCFSCWLVKEKGRSYLLFSKILCKFISSCRPTPAIIIHIMVRFEGPYHLHRVGMLACCFFLPVWKLARDMQIASAPLIISLVRSCAAGSKRPLNINFQTIISGAVGWPFFFFFILTLRFIYFFLDSLNCYTMWHPLYFLLQNFVCIFMAIQMQATGADASSVQFIENGHPISWRHGW